MKKFILLILIALLSSCAITRDRTRVQFINAIVFQVLDNNTALAYDTNSHNVIQLITRDEIYYDGRNIVGTFVLVDTYSYVTTKGNINTVPMYIRLLEYNKYITR